MTQSSLLEQRDRGDSFTDTMVALRDCTKSEGEMAVAFFKFSFFLPSFPSVLSVLFSFQDGKGAIVAENRHHDR